FHERQTGDPLQGPLDRGWRILTQREDPQLPVGQAIDLRCLRTLENGWIVHSVGTPMEERRASAQAGSFIRAKNADTRRRNETYTPRRTSSSLRDRARSNSNSTT